MRIGIDVREFKEGVYTGLRTILRNFLRHACGSRGHEFVFFGNQYTDFASLPECGEKVILRERNTFWWDQFQLPIALRKKKIGVFFSPYIKTPLWRVCPYVNAICDTIPLIVPRYGGIRAVLEKMHFLFYSFLCGHRAARVITLSEDAKARICRIFGIGQEKLKVVYPSVEAAVMPQEPDEKDKGFITRYGLHKPYILYVGNFKPHKNLSRLITAFGLLPQEIKQKYRLILVGGSEKETVQIKPLIERRGLAGKVIPVRNVDSDSVHVFLRNASIFVFPSLAEGFGIPPVEAIAAGVPVAASNLAPMTEVLGDAALFFDPYNPEDIAGAILKLLDGQAFRKRYVIQGYKRVALFNPAGISQKILDILEDAGEGKALLISSEFPPLRGGIATQVFNLWKRLPKKKAIVLTARVKGGKGYTADGGPCIIRKRYPLGSDIFSRIVRTAALAWHVWRLNSLWNIRCNHCGQIISSGVAGLLMRKFRGIPYVVYVYSADILEFSRCFFSRWVMRKVFGGCRQVIANSHFTEGLILERKLVSQDIILVLTPGVDTDLFTPDRGDGGVRGKLGIPSDARMLLTVSRLEERKGHDRIIEALPGVLERYPRLFYVIVGDGSRKAALQNMVRERGLERNVFFSGKVSPEELPFFYNACDIFVMTPRYIRRTGDVEGFGVVFLEANACGKPVIAGKSGGVPEAVIDGETGVLVDPEAPVRIREAVLLLLENEDYARRLGNKGMMRVRREFSWENRAKKLREMI